MTKRALTAGVAAAAVLVSAGSALAGGFSLREQSAYSQGASFAGAATAGDSISGMFWNPAVVTSAEGFVSESHHSLVLPKSELDVDPTISPLAAFGYGNGGDLGIDSYIPAGYAAYKINEDWYLGISVNGQYGLATHAEQPWVGQTDHLHAKVFSTNISPTVGYKINDMISIAAGAQIQYFKVDIDRATGITPTAPAANVTGDDWGFGFTAGVTLTPFDGTEIGLGFRSSVSHTLEGDLTTPLGSNGISAEVDLPEMVTLGLRQRVNEQFTLLGGIEWSNWSRLGTIPVVLDVNGATATELEFEYEDGWFFSLGGEYAWNEALTLRAGAAYEISPVQDEFRSARLPDADRIWASVGASYKVSENISFDASYTHIFVDDAEIAVTSPVPYGGTAEGSVDIFSVAARFKL